MYKILLKRLETQYNKLMKIQYEIFKYEDYVKTTPEDKILSYRLEKLEVLRTEEKDVIEFIKLNIKELEKTTNNLWYKYEK